MEERFILNIILPNDTVDNMEIDIAEYAYIMDQIKYNQPFVIILNDIVRAYSPLQCVKIEISPVKQLTK